MEIGVDLDAETVEELESEADLQGFDSLGAYLRWIVAHRPMSDLGADQAPAVASRVSELEERVTLIERQLDLDDPVAADLGDAGGGVSEPSAADSGASGASLDPGGGGGGGGDFESEFETKAPDAGEEAEPIPDEPEDAAADDDIAEAIGDVSLDDEE